MSQRHELAIRELQRRVADLEAWVAAQRQSLPAEPAPVGPFKAAHKHLGLWFIQDAAGNVCEQFGTMKKADAKRIADELNAAQH